MSDLGTPILNNSRKTLCRARFVYDLSRAVMRDVEQGRTPAKAIIDRLELEAEMLNTAVVTLKALVKP